MYNLFHIYIRYYQNYIRNYFAQLIDSPFHEDGKTLQLLFCNYVSLDRVKFQSLDSPLTDANDYKCYQFGISVDSDTKPIYRFLYPDIHRAKFDIAKKKFFTNKIGKLNITTEKTYKNFMTYL